jgi:filamin
VIYYPTKPGDYTVHVTCNGKDIPKSPFTVPITPGGDASKCYAEGPGLEPNGLVSGNVFILTSVAYCIY